MRVCETCSVWCVPRKTKRGGEGIEIVSGSTGQGQGGGGVVKCGCCSCLPPPSLRITERGGIVAPLSLRYPPSPPRERAPLWSHDAIHGNTSGEGGRGG